MADWGFVLWLVGLSAITFFTVAWLLDINNRQRQLQTQLDQAAPDADGSGASEALKQIEQRMAETDAQTSTMHEEVTRLVGNLPNSVQAVGLVRFQAFSDYGGDQSFSLALANASGDGVVLSGIFAREGTRVYAKSLKSWTSTYSLSFEEEEAVSQAKSQLE